MNRNLLLGLVLLAGASCSEETPLSPPARLARALLLQRLEFVDNGRPLADPVDRPQAGLPSYADRLKQACPEASQELLGVRGTLGDAAAGYLTYSETLAYVLKAVVLAVEAHVLDRGEGQAAFDAILDWAEKNMRIGSIDQVFDASPAQCRLRPIGEVIAGRTARAESSPDARLFAWRWIPGFGVVVSNDPASKLDSLDVATDADLELAGALVLAAETWGKEAYEERALEIAQAIEETLVVTETFKDEGTLSVLTAGSGLKAINAINASYFLFADMERLESAGDTESGQLLAAISTTSWSLLDKTTRYITPAVGIPPNWAQVVKGSDGELIVKPIVWTIQSAEVDRGVGWDALRVPIRLREARGAGVDATQVAAYWKEWGENAVACLEGRRAEDGQFPTVIDQECSRSIEGETAAGLVAWRSLFLETEHADLAAEVEERLFGSMVSCTDPGELPPYGCTRAYLGQADDYYPTHLLILSLLNELLAEGSNERR